MVNGIGANVAHTIGEVLSVELYPTWHWVFF